MPLQLVADLLDAGKLASSVMRDQPFPESGTKIEAIVEILCLYEDVCVEKILCHAGDPTSRLNFSNVSVFEMPNIRKASR
jgi:hypothetical protein